jgi:hypothetical protein
VSDSQKQAKAHIDAVKCFIEQIWSVCRVGEEESRGKCVTAFVTINTKTFLQGQNINKKAQI